MPLRATSRERRKRRGPRWFSGTPGEDARRRLPRTPSLSRIEGRADQLFPDARAGPEVPQLARQPRPPRFFVGPGREKRVILAADADCRALRPLETVAWRGDDKNAVPAVGNVCSEGCLDPRTRSPEDPIVLAPKRGSAVGAFRRTDPSEAAFRRIDRACLHGCQSRPEHGRGIRSVAPEIGRVGPLWRLPRELPAPGGRCR